MHDCQMVANLAATRRHFHKWYQLRKLLLVQVESSSTLNVMEEHWMTIGRWHSCRKSPTIICHINVHLHLIAFQSCISHKTLLQAIFSWYMTAIKQHWVRMVYIPERSWTLPTTINLLQQAAAFFVAGSMTFRVLRKSPTMVRNYRYY